MKYVWVVARNVDLGYEIKDLYEHLMDVPYQMEPTFYYTWQGSNKPLLKGNQIEDRYITNDPDIFVFKQEVK